MKERKIRHLKQAGFIFIFACALALRFYCINKYDLWFDELISNYYAYDNIALLAKINHVPVFSIFNRYIACDPSSVLYYFLVYIYSFLFGAGKALRALSAVLSASSLVILYKLTRQFFDKRTGVYAILLMALSPMQIWYAQEARAYAAAVFLSVSTVYFFIRALRTNRLLYLSLFAVSCISLCYATYYCVFLLFPMGIMFIFNRRRQSNTRWALTSLIVLLSVVPLLPVFAKHMSSVKGGFWLSAPSLRIMLNSFTVFIMGYSSGIWQIYTAPVIFLGLYIYGFYCYCRRDSKNAIPLSLLFLFPVAAVYFISRYVTPLYLYRQLLIFTPFYYIFIARGLRVIRNNLFRKAVTIIVFLYLGISLINYYNGYMLSFPGERKYFYPGIHMKKNYSDVISYVNKSLEKGDAIITTDIQSYVIFASFLKGYTIRKRGIEIGYFFYPYAAEYCLGTKALVKFLDMDNLSYETGKLHGWWLKDGLKMPSEIRLDGTPFKRIWLVSSAWHINGVLQRNSRSIREYMSGKYERLYSMEKDGIYLELFLID